MFVLDADYTIEDNKPVIRLFCRSDSKKSAVVYDRAFEPYFYAIAKKGAKSAREKVSQVSVSDEKGIASVKRVESIEKIIGLKEKKILKVFAKLPFDVPKLKDAVAALPEIEGVREFDIPFFKKYLIDKKILPLSWTDVTGDKTESSLSADTAIDAKSISAAGSIEYNPSLFAFDLETIPEEGANKIIMASVCTDAGYKKVIVYEKDNFSESIHVASEKAVIEKLGALVKEKDPDLVLTYNGDSFDFDVLRNRAEKYKTIVDFGRDGQGVKYQRKGRINAASIRGRVHIDLFQFVSRIMRPTISAEVMSLDNVSGELTGSRKKDMTWETMIESWQKKKDLDKLAEYCLNDSEITVGLAKALLPNIFALSRLTGSTPFDTCRATYGQLVEAYALRRASGLNIAVPNKPTQDVVRERMEMDKFQGAFVVEPKPGLHKNIALFDFRSLYPSIIASHNIEPDTLNCKCCKSKKENRVPGTSSHFCTKQKGFIPRLVEELIRERIEMKKRMKAADKKSDEYKSLNAKQFAVKTLANSFYGYLGFAGSRWYLRECAEAVTAFGRHYIHKVIEMAEGRGLKCIYGDTDSLFLLIEKDTEKVARKFLKDVNSTLPGIMELDYEGTYLRGIFVQKKTGEGGAKKRYALIDKEGNVTIRGFEKVRRDWSKLAKDTQEKVIELVLSDKKDDAVEYVKNIIERVKSGNVELKELGIYTTVKRDLNKYAQIGPHVSAARKAEKRGMAIHPGTTIHYVVTRGRGSISDRAELMQYAKNYDKEYYLENQIIPAALRALSVLGVTKDDLLGNAKQTGLGKWGNAT